MFRTKAEQRFWKGTGAAIISFACQNSDIFFYQGRGAAGFTDENVSELDNWVSDNDAKVIAGYLRLIECLQENATQNATPMKKSANFLPLKFF